MATLAIAFIPFLVANHLYILYVKTKELNTELHTLHEMGQSISSTLDINMILNKILNLSGLVVQFTHGYVLLFNEGSLKPALCWGDNEIGIDLKVTTSKGLIGDIIKKGSSEIINDLEGIKKNIGITNLPKSIKSLAVAPLINNGTLIGMIILGTNATNNYTQRHSRFLNTFANQAAIAVMNARLYQKTVDISQRDDLTKLYNHRTFCDVMQKLINNKSTFAFVMIDIDYFKKFNDNYGHLAGNDILRDVATIMGSNLRDDDYLCRIGGEEFGIILPGVSKDIAFQVSERIRQSIEDYIFLPGKFNNPGLITISAGIAMFPDDAKTMDRLIYCADHALLRGAKDSGRNRVVEFKESV